MVPMLDTITQVYERRNFRRWRFLGYRMRDRFLDAVCKRITGSRSDTLVAFGNASTCSTGFSYAPAPQQRLRHRLEKIHHAKIVMVDEYHTSQMCNSCHNKLEHAIASHSPEEVDRSERLTKMKKCHRLHPGRHDVRRNVQGKNACMLAGYARMQRENHFYGM